MSNKKLYSSDGKACVITKETKGGKVMNCGFVDMKAVTASLQQDGKVVVVDVYGGKKHGINRTEVERIVNLFKNEIAASTEKRDDALNNNMHSNCYRGSDY